MKPNANVPASRSEGNDLLARVIRIPDYELRAAKQRPASSRVPVLLTPSRIQQMIADRRQLQVIKFRTTCSDVAPSY